MDPWLIGFPVFACIPFSRRSLYYNYSFTDYDIIYPPRVIGFANYQLIAGYSHFNDLSINGLPFVETGHKTLDKMIIP
ncbi:hypothetical protein [Paenibacillus sp. S150]|uniref:hypothetical protein n=1 Tax=Paenibacillus sp. S150 TaxID=2749826 RepID=UPI001C55E747|nr:hypothetical protein [Paenibacillus sp. S150]MBW4085631.1 hypothetical protein [Paenibacillus sp. S150]